MSFRRVRAIARKEFLHILRDRRSLMMALALPALLLILFGYALTLDVDRIPVLVVDHDGSLESRDLVSRFEGSRYFDLLGTVDSLEIVEESIDRGNCLAALVIDRDFASDLGRGRTASVQLILDGSDSNTASIALGYAEAIIARYSAEQMASRSNRIAGGVSAIPVEARARVWYNSELRSKNYIVPGLVAVILMIIAALLTSLTIAREWEMGTMEQLLSTPVRPAELVLGKMSAYFLLGAVDTITAILLGVVIFEVPLRGNLILLAVSCAVFLIGALCWGIFLSASVRSQLLAYQVGLLSSFLPAFLLSGFIFAIKNMPLPVQVATYLVPARYFITVLRGIFLKDVGLLIIGGELFLLFAFAAAVFAFATRKLKGKIA
ncbi:MAG: ABC transporter permease [Acidobacteriota bacterium]|nr:MAG: ABC transporter permease [Acidobacteriota bacterium]